MYQTNGKEWDLKKRNTVENSNKRTAILRLHMLFIAVAQWPPALIPFKTWFGCINRRKTHVSKNTMEKQCMVVVFVFIVIIIIISYSQVTFQPKNKKCLAGFSATQTSPDMDDSINIPYRNVPRRRWVYWSEFMPWLSLKVPVYTKATHGQHNL